MRLGIVLAGEKVSEDKRVARALELYERMESVRLGKSKPHDAKEALALADVAGYFAKRHALATSLYRQAFEEKPLLAANLVKAHRFRACQSSLAAGLGIGVDAVEGADDPAREKLRKQALLWWRAEVAARKEEIAEQGLQAPAARLYLDSLRKTPMAVRLKQQTTLAHLTPQERKDWTALLKEIEHITVPPMPKAKD